MEYGYDSTYGDRTTQSTFRGGTGWDGSTWPGSPGTADTTTWAYDGPSGLMTSKTDALSRATLYTYNVRGQLATREWARLVGSGPSTGQRVKTTYSYNATAGEQTAIDYNDNLTTGLTYTYNRMGQAEYITDVTGVRQFEYCTPCGVVLSETLDSTYFGGRKLTYKRDQSTTGRLGQGVGYQLGTASAPASDQEVTYLYENLNRLTGLTTGFANNSSTRTFRYGYEPDSALLKTLAVEGSPFLVTRSYESDRDYLTSIETKGNSPIETYVRYEYTYDERGQRKTALQAGTAYADYGNSTYRRFSYNGRGELTAALGYMGTDVTQTTDYLPGRQFEYAFDNIGNRQWSNRTGVSSLRDDYTTNALNQYTGRENNTVSISGTATSDAIVAVNGRNVTSGRRGRFWSDEVTVSNVLGPWRGPLSVYAAKPSGGNYVLRLDSRTSQLPPIAETLTYDDDGNPASDGFWIYQWDAENRLIRMETTTVAQTAGVPHRILEFQYDYLGRRVQKRVIDGAASQEISCRRLIYQGWDVIGEYAAAGGTSFGALIRTYTWGLDIARSLADAGGVGALLQISDHASGRSYLPAYDGNGNIAALTNAATGIIAATYEYTPFGETLRSDVLDSAIHDQPFRFSTKWFDQENGLINYGRRYFDARHGRFVGRDPITEKGGLNLYTFCGNNPINRWDKLGLVYPGGLPVNAAQALEAWSDPQRVSGQYLSAQGMWGFGSEYATGGMSSTDVAEMAGGAGTDVSPLPYVRQGSGLPPVVVNLGGLPPITGTDVPNTPRPKVGCSFKAANMAAGIRSATSLSNVSNFQLGGGAVKQENINRFRSDLAELAEKGGLVGLALVNKLLTSGTPVNILWGDSLGAAGKHLSQGSNVIIGPNSIYSASAGNFFTLNSSSENYLLNGGGNSSEIPDHSSIVLAHEFGHVLLGAEYELVNVSFIENAVRLAMGEAIRTTYSGEDPLLYDMRSKDMGLPPTTPYGLPPGFYALTQEIQQLSAVSTALTASIQDLDCNPNL